MGKEPSQEWTPPLLDVATIRTGDMPGDKVSIDQSHIKKANAIVPHVLNDLPELGEKRITIAVYGGSGVGKSEIGSVLGQYLEDLGYPTYILSGDNYPYRIPEHNDLERLSAFRNAGLGALADHPDFQDAWSAKLQAKWPSMEDFQPEAFPQEDAAWIEEYYAAGRDGLKNYLGTAREIDFPFLNHIVQAFRSGSSRITLKRMGRTADDIRLESVDFTGTQVLIVEWTHGNNAALNGIDYPIFLFSTPAETRAHRLARSRDSNTDTPFISLVLEIEQERLVSQADRARLIISRDGEVLSLSELSDRLNPDSGR